MKFSIATLLLLTGVVAYGCLLTGPLEHAWYESLTYLGLLAIVCDGFRFGWLNYRASERNGNDLFILLFSLSWSLLLLANYVLVVHLEKPLHQWEWLKEQNPFKFYSSYLVLRSTVAIFHISLLLGCALQAVATRPRKLSLHRWYQGAALESAGIFLVLCWLLFDRTQLSGLVHLAIDNILRSHSHIAGDPWDLAGNNWTLGWQRIFVVGSVTLIAMGGSLWLLNWLRRTQSPRCYTIAWGGLFLATAVNFGTFCWIWVVGTQQLNLLWREPNNAVLTPVHLPLAVAVAMVCSFVGADFWLRTRILPTSESQQLPFQAWSHTRICRSMFLIVVIYYVAILLNDYFDPTNYRSLPRPSLKAYAEELVLRAFQPESDIFWDIMLLLLAVHGFRWRKDESVQCIPQVKYHIADFVLVALLLGLGIFAALPSLLFAGTALWCGGVLN